MFGSTEAAAFHVYVSAFFFFVTLKRYCSSLLWAVAVTFDRKQCICALFMDPQITFFNNFFIKNGSHNTIYTFKNYFATVFSVFSFQFQQNKFYPNRPIEYFPYEPHTYKNINITHTPKQINPAPKYLKIKAQSHKSLNTTYIHAHQSKVKTKNLTIN